MFVTTAFLYTIMTKKKIIAEYDGFVGVHTDYRRKKAKWIKKIQNED